MKDQEKNGQKAAKMFQNNQGDQSQKFKQIRDRKVNETRKNKRLQKFAAARKQVIQLKNKPKQTVLQQFRPKKMTIVDQDLPQIQVNREQTSHVKSNVVRRGAIKRLNKQQKPQKQKYEVIKDNQQRLDQGLYQNKPRRQAATLLINKGVSMNLNYFDQKWWIGYKIQNQNQNYSYYTKNCIRLSQNQLKLLESAFNWLKPIKTNINEKHVYKIGKSKCKMIKDIYKGKLFYGLRMYSYFREQNGSESQYFTKNGFVLRQQQMESLVKAIKDYFKWQS